MKQKLFIKTKYQSSFFLTKKLVFLSSSIFFLLLKSFFFIFDKYSVSVTYFSYPSSVLSSLPKISAISFSNYSLPCLINNNS